LGNVRVPDRNPAAVWDNKITMANLKRESC
jgi:hypothetical protein